MMNMCSSTVQFFGAAALLCMIAAAFVLVPVIRAYIFRFKEKHRRLRMLGVALIAASLLFLALSIFFPPAYTLLYYKGHMLEADGRDPCALVALSYCGAEYCLNETPGPAASNCTCLLG